MAYIGRDTDKLSNIEVLDAITFDGSSSYTLQKNSVNFTPSSANNVLVSIDGVVQANNFTVSGSTIDFGVAVPSTSTCDWIYHIGVGLITTPADGTVTAAKLSASAITSQTEDTTPADDDLILVYDTSATALKKVQKSNFAGGGITEIDMWRKTSGSSGNQTTVTGWERPDNGSFGYIGTGMTESSGIFTFPSTGIWSIQYVARVAVDGGGSSRHLYAGIEVTTDNSTYTEVAEGDAGITNVDASDENNNAVTEYFFDVTNTSTHKCKFNFSHIATGGTAYIQGDTNKNITYVRFIRYGDT